jgi:hypothetical protein
MKYRKGREREREREEIRKREFAVIVRMIYYPKGKEIITCSAPIFLFLFFTFL